MQTIEQILRAGNLTSAYYEVFRNHGAAGVDKMQVEELKGYLDSNREALIEQIHKSEYRPQPIRGKEIPKSPGKVRLLGIPTVIDRMLQQAVARVVMAKWEFTFSEHSYGFRPERNAHQAVKRALEYINSGYQDIVDIDLKSFFDEVSHVLMLELLNRKIKCPATLKLIRLWLRAPLEKDGVLVRRTKGVPQGSPLSPLLSNIILDELDKEMTRRGLRFVRYADDFSIYCRTKAEAKQVGNSLYLFLKNKLKLPINTEKSGIRRPVNFNLLGYGFVPTYRKGEQGKYQLIVEGKRWERLKTKLKEITRKTKPLPLEQRLQKLKEVQRGWINYFRYAHLYAKLKELDGWLRNRIRYCIWKDWKRPERRRKSYIQLGIDPQMAYAWSRSRKGGWAIAQSPILGTTVTKERLEKKGYESLLSWYFKISPHYQYSPLFPIV